MVIEHPEWKNELYYGDNLPVMREYIADESVDLVYLDPPFNSRATYNVLFKEKSGEDSPAQIKAFTDTWEWTEEAERTYHQDIIYSSATPSAVKDTVVAFRQFIGQNAMMAYLVMMTPRLVELRRVLKPTGSLYLHCDPTASHYLKLIMDSVFGSENFRNEISWRRSNPKSHGSVNFPNCRDVILRYSKSSQTTFNMIYESHDPEYVKKAYKYADSKGQYRLLPLLNPNDDRPNLTYEFLGVTRVWRWTRERMEQAYRDGVVVQLKPGAVPQYKKYLADSKGRTITDDWSDIEQAAGKEALGYPTQKPLALLERVIQASTNAGDLVLDPFCGCGTAVAAAEKLKRRWIGIDITHLAVALMKNRLKTMFNLEPGRDYDVLGEPKDVGSAQALAEQDRYQFQYWALSLLEAQPQREERRKGADRGIDGVLYFPDGPRGTPHKSIIQVKSGHVSSPQIRDLKGVVEREKASLGLFISLEDPTRDMRTEAASGGLFHSSLWGKDFPKIQIRTVGELLEGNPFDIPQRPAMYQPADRVMRPEGRQAKLAELIHDSGE